MTGKREKQILNTLLVICLVAGFICFSFILLPNQLKKAGVSPAGSSINLSLQKISNVISLDWPIVQKPAAPSGNVALFVPDASSASPPQEILITAPVKNENTMDNEVAGAAGAAIDDKSAESRQGQHDPAALNGSVELKFYPISSIARHDPSALDNETSRQKKPWILTPEGLESDVAFWRDIYSKYNRNQKVLHHPRYLNIIYDVVDLSDIEKDGRLNDVEREHMRDKRVEERKKTITDILLKLATNPPASSLSDEEWRIKKMFHGINETNVFRRAAEEDSVRSQLGQRDKFIAGLKYSGRYLGEIESIFESLGLPKELTRLTFVESTFNPDATSSAGASGIWQFMRDTGKLYLQISDLADERNDPILETHAAAKLLQHDYEILGFWPLAINAYNAGRGRMQQAATVLDTTDIGQIIKKFDHPSYGFASRNFFLEFLAALDVAEHAEKYFGPIEYDKPLRFEVVRTNYNISLPDVAKIAGMNMDEILELNPSLTPKVANGLKLLPIGFALKLPEKKGELFLAAAARAPKSTLGPLKHVIQKDETLESVAQMYGVTPGAIIRSNNNMSRVVHLGQIISVPVGGQ